MSPVSLSGMYFKGAHGEKNNTDDGYINFGGQPAGMKSGFKKANGKYEHGCRYDQEDDIARKQPFHTAKVGKGVV